MRLNLGYKFVAMMLMAQEATFFCRQTGLPPARAFGESDMRKGGHIGPYNPKDFGGSIVTDDYFFGFGWGHLANFRKSGFMPDGPDSAIRERNLELSKRSSLIDTNGAYQLATNWLAALGVDVPALERKYRLNFIQWRYYPNGKDGPVIMLPVYHVEWLGFILRSQPNRERAVVSVTIFGATKELVEYHVLDDSLFLRRRISIPNAEKLLAISDDEFRRFDGSQRSNLLAQFTVPAENNPSPTPLQNAHTNTVRAPGREKASTNLLGSPTRLPLKGHEVHRVPSVPSHPAEK